MSQITHIILFWAIGVAIGYLAAVAYLKMRQKGILKPTSWHKNLVAGGGIKKAP